MLQSNIDSTIPSDAGANPDVRRLGLAAVAMLGVAFLGDFLFWGSAAGASVGIFCAALGCLVAVKGRWTVWTLGLLVLLGASSWQSVVELSFTNLVSLGALLVLLLAEGHYREAATLWQRVSDALDALFRGPLRWREYGNAFKSTHRTLRESGRMQGPPLARVVQAVFPAVLACVGFAILLVLGNRALDTMVHALGRALARLVLDFSFLRTLLWLAWLTLGLALFWPSAPAGRPQWTAWPRWRRDDPSLARWQSGLLLAGVNVLFFAANTTDAIYLWFATAGPGSASYSQALHDGVQSLILAVLAAGGVLTLLFQQDESVASSRWLKGLAAAWIGQNLVLLASVFLRLKFYVDSYQLSELRLYVACFLVLVAVGLLLLLRQVVRGMRLGQLVLGNLAAVFILWFGLQFCDVARWVAEWNVARWEQDPRRPLDLDYLVQLGPGAWPALLKVARSGRDSTTASAAARQVADLVAAGRGAAPADWRSFQARREGTMAQLRQATGEP